VAAGTWVVRVRWLSRRGRSKLEERARGGGMALSPSDASCRFPVTSSESPSSQAKDSLPPASPRTTDTPFLRLMQHSRRHMRFCNISPRRHYPGGLPASSARGPIPLRHPQAVTQTGAVPVGGSSRSSVCCLCGEGRGGAALAQAGRESKIPCFPLGDTERIAYRPGRPPNRAEDGAVGLALDDDSAVRQGLARHQAASSWPA